MKGNSHPKNDVTINPSGNQSIRDVLARVDEGRRQFLIDDSATNFGWAPIGDESVTQTTKRIYSRESILTGNRPVLTLEVTPIPERSTFATLLAGLALLSVATARRRP